MTTREFRVYGWQQIAESLPFNPLRADLFQAVRGLNETTGLELEVSEDEAAQIDEIANNKSIGPHDIPDLGFSIKGLGNPKPISEEDNN